MNRHYREAIPLNSGAGPKQDSFRMTDPQGPKLANLCKPKIPIVPLGRRP